MLRLWRRANHHDSELEGVVEFFKQETPRTFGSILNAVSPGLGDSLIQELVKL